MRRVSRQAPANALFVVAAAEALPAELDGTISGVSIYLPWGSLLRGLVGPSPVVLRGIARLLRPGGAAIALLSIAERDGGEPLGPRSIDRAAYVAGGLEVVDWRPAMPEEVAAADSSWAKRLQASSRRSVWILVTERR
ncbi:MAG TPA: hypothetical protein VKR80_04530 [Candidatus Limnocylindria bacterium]|nr:hypothetical protein [Candidatus Limnocylindria bacterium]